MHATQVATQREEQERMYIRMLERHPLLDAMPLRWVRCTSSQISTTHPT